MITATKTARPADGRTMLAVSPEAAERARDAAHHDRVTVKALVENAILAEVDRREKAHGKRFSFPPRH
jgi:predicted HicB family RNase H-like nuclease